MDDYERQRFIDKLGYDVESLKDHKKECDADMEAHGRMLFQADNRMSNIEANVVRVADSYGKDKESFEKAIRSLQDFRLRIVSTWIATVAIGMGIGSLIGFVMNLIWKKS